MSGPPLLSPFPTLKTRRLILRALRPDDLDDLYAYASDPMIDAYVPWRHYQSIDEARADLQEFLDEYTADGGMGAFGVELASQQRLIGICTFSPPHHHHRRSELGYTIARADWGHGYATEAVTALIRFGFEHMQLIRIEAVVLPENHASAKVLLKAGMHFEGLLQRYQIWRGVPRDLQMYAICNPAL